MASQDPSWLREWESVDHIWTRLHRTQTDFCFGQELSWYFTSSDWLRSKHVIDVGTGCGHYLHRIAGTFPEKVFFGIDVNEFFVETAKRSVRERNVHFECFDLHDVEGQYDAAIVRLVMQHLSDAEKGLRKVAELLRPGGTAFVIDAADPFRYFYPEPREFVRFFTAYASAVRSDGKDRDIAARIPDLISAKIPQLRCAANETALIPSTVPGNAILFEETYYLVIELLERVNAFPHDFASVKRAWLSWCRLPRKYMQVGIRCVKLVREGN